MTDNGKSDMTLPDPHAINGDDRCTPDMAMKASRYPGGKGGAGVHQTIIMINDTASSQTYKTA